MAVQVKVATQNPVKLNSIKKAFERLIGDEVEIIDAEVESGVPRQPINQQVFTGAENRINEIMKDSIKYDYYVSCEGGLLNLYGNWMNVHVIIVRDREGKKGVGLSQGYQIPDRYISEAIATSISSVLDRIYEGSGGIRVLSKGQFTRDKLIEDGTIMALTKILNGDIW